MVHQGEPRVNVTITITSPGNRGAATALILEA